MTAAGEGAPALSVSVRGIRIEADQIRSFEFAARPGEVLPSAAAGSHIDILLPDGGERSYSLLQAVDGKAQSYRIAVKREAESRGGSSYLCDMVRVGDLVRIRPPSNAFPLVETAPHSVFIAGGIGITPILSMVRRLDALGRSWALYAAARSRDAMPFLDVLEGLEAAAPGRIRLRFSDLPASGFTLEDVGRDLPAGAHLYCCGPARMIQAFESTFASWPEAQRHHEYFQAEAPVAEGGFEVVLARSGRSVQVPRDSTILETLLAEGMNLPRSCMEGVCGTCETVVLEGVPDHRDNVLSQREKRSNRKMIICRSGCIGDRLVLDL